MLELCFVLAPGQDPLILDTAEALRDELAALGVDARTTTDEFPEPRAGLVYVLVSPLEYTELRDGRLPAQLLSRSVLISTDPPGSKRFEANTRLATLAGGVLDLSRSGVREMRRLGIPAEHLQLGYTAAWDRFDPGRTREIDLAYVASPCRTFADRRDPIVGSWAEWLWRHRTELLIPDDLLASEVTDPGSIGGEEMRALLASAKVLLSLHPTDVPAFPWPRALQAILNGAILATEPAMDFEPLSPGEHFISGRAEELPLLAGELLDDGDHRERIARAAYELVRHGLPMQAAAERLVALAEPLATRRVGRGIRARLALRSGFAGMEQPLDVTLTPLRLRVKAPARRSLRARKRSSLEAIERGRRAAELGVAGNGRGGAIELAHETGPRAAGAAPRVSVIVPVFNEERRVVAALDSVWRSRLGEFELVVVDDGSSDGTLDVVREWMRDHASVPALLARHPANRGLPATRNAAIELARGEEILPLDADNQIYPHCLERLTAALGSDPEAPFAYGILQTFDETGPRGVIGYFDWEPRRLWNGNYIDVLALIRKRALVQVGGFTTDIRLYGWEDYDLWCAFAARAMRPVHVREIVARYRRSADSMISLTNLSREDAYDALAERHPSLFSELGPAGATDR
jgi:hypothetical protein